MARHDRGRAAPSDFSSACSPPSIIPQQLALTCHSLWSWVNSNDDRAIALSSHYTTSVPAKFGLYSVSAKDNPFSLLPGSQYWLFVLWMYLGQCNWQIFFCVAMKLIKALRSVPKIISSKHDSAQLLCSDLPSVSFSFLFGHGQRPSVRPFGNSFRVSFFFAFLTHHMHLKTNSTPCHQFHMTWSLRRILDAGWACRCLYGCEFAFCFCLLHSCRPHQLVRSSSC